MKGDVSIAQMDVLISVDSFRDDKELDIRRDRYYNKVMEEIGFLYHLKLQARRC